jgi:replicative DNA helicase
MIVTLDLMTMLREFSGETPAAYEEGMNELSAFTKESQIHIINIIQAGRISEAANVPGIDQVSRLRPHLKHIKNSGAIAERCRLVLGVFRPFYYASRLFPNAPELETMDDIMEVQILKQSNGPVGEIVEYLHHGGKFKLIPFIRPSTDTLSS